MLHNLFYLLHHTARDQFSITNCRYVAASLGLAGMVPYQDISEASGFPDGFRYRGYNWAADLTAVSGKHTSDSVITKI
jgi:hypothetical protein